MQSLVWLSVTYVYPLKFCILIIFLQFQLEHTLFYRTSKLFSESVGYGPNCLLHIPFAFYISVELYFTLKTSHIDFYQLFFDSKFLYKSKTRYVHIITHFLLFNLLFLLFLIFAPLKYLKCTLVYDVRGSFFLKAYFFLSNN